MQYQIMHKNTVIAFADEERITEILIPDLCPACFAIGMPLTRWLDDSMIDTNRAHARLLFKALRMRPNADIHKLIEVGHGISITDNWWIQRTNESLDYRALKQYNEELADIALYGASDSQSGDISGYRELGTVGSFEKAWRFLEGSWYMFKQGSTTELISEYFAYQFLKAMGVGSAEYQIHRTVSGETGLESVCIVTRDFTENASVDFEPFSNYYDDREEPEYILSRLSKNLHTDYVMMLFYDALLFNGDRHNQNVGFLRNSETGETLGLAPYFDFNLSLAAVGVPRIDAEKGNVFTRELLSNEICCAVVKENLPERERVQHAVSAAADATSAAFPDQPFRYQLFEDYILQTYDFFVSHLL